MVKKKKIEKFNSFQTAFIKWAINKRAMLVQALPGSGKTLSVYGFFLLLRNKFGGKLLVVTARKNAEAFKIANVKNLLLLTLFSKQDLAVFYSGYDFPADIYILSNTLLSSIVLQGTEIQKRALTELLKKVTVLAIDEIHNFRAYDSSRSKAMKKVTDFYHKLIQREPENHRLVGITATPVFKNLENLHPLFNLLCYPNPLGTWRQFVDRYCEVQQFQTYGNRRMYSSYGSHSYKDTLSFEKIIGYKNVDHLHSVVDPYIFVWDDTDFKVNFGLHYYSLLPDEVERYKASIKGLGLDKTYAVSLEVDGVQKWVYRNKADSFFLLNKREIQTGSLQVGLVLSYGGSMAVVKGIYEKKVDAGFATRAVKAQQCNSKAVNKLALIGDLIESKDMGALVYFNFLDSVDVTYKYLMQRFPGRRVVTLTGGTQNFNIVVGSIQEKDIVLMSSVASQSLDIFIQRLLIAECFGLTPGKVEQLAGRMTRENAGYRDVSVDFVLREGENIEAYFYEKLRHRLRVSKTNVLVTAEKLPPSEAVSKIPDHLIDEDWLKKRLLWSVS